MTTARKASEPPPAEPEVHPPPANPEERFFDQQAHWVEHQRLWGRWVAPLLALAVFVLAWYLGSRGGVIAYVILLAGAAAFGLQAYQKALVATAETVHHLQEVDGLLQTAPTRESFLAFVDERRSPHDLSNVPEAFYALRAGAAGAERARAVANSAFAEPNGCLTATAYVRNALVLGGLFGTVFFFARQLAGGWTSTANLLEMLPEIRGAMVSTLTGIVSSVTLGYLSNRLERRIDKMIWATEEMVAGPVADALAEQPEARRVGSEAELWTHILEEIRKLRAETAAHVAQIEHGTAARLLALQEVEDRIASLPQLQLREDVERLGPALREFSTGVAVFQSSASAVGNALETLGTLVPSELLRRTEALTHDAMETRTRVEGAIQDLRGPVGAAVTAAQAARQEVQALRAETLDPRPLLSRLESVEAGSRALGLEMQELRAAVRAQQETVQAVHAALAPDHDAHAALADARSSLLQATDAIQREAGQLGQENAGIAAAARRLEAVGGELTDAARSSSEAAAQIVRVALPLVGEAERIERTEMALRETQGMVRRALAALAPMVEWHRRAARAPLMRVLLLGWRPRAAAAGSMALTAESESAAPR